MAIQTTTWRPDTCGCEIDYQWDDTLSEDVRTHDLSAVKNACSEHPGLSDQEIYDAVLHENTTKNVVMGIISDNFPAITKQVVDDDGNITNVFMKKMAPLINYDPIKNIDLSNAKSSPVGKSKQAVNARPIKLSIPALTPKDIQQAQSLIDAQFGPGIVTVS